MLQPALIVLILMCLGIAQQTDRVHNLITQYSYPWYSGFLNISSQKSLHYIFFESQHDNDNDPIVLWLGADLGCSSLIAMVQQNGPFIFDQNTTTHHLNNYSWNKYSSLLYIETPAPVGFSIGEGSNSDESVAKDNLQAVVAFLSTHPTLRNNALYLSGSGYAGTTAPFLAMKIHQYNNLSSTHIKINLKGLLLGNPCVHPSECHDPGVDGISYHGFQFLYKHAFYSQEQFLTLKTACYWQYSNTYCYQIRSAYQKLFRDTNTSKTNIYSYCNYQKDHYGDMTCQDTKGADAFFNYAPTQLNLHVFETKKDWKLCNHEVAYKFKMSENGSFPLIQTLMKHYKIWIYSGDVSVDVPLLGTINWIQKLRDEMHLPVMQPWRQWWVKGLHPAEDQVAGMVWKLKNLTLVTVRGAGFQSGRDKPEALDLIIKNFLTGTDLPRKG